MRELARAVKLAIVNWSVITMVPLVIILAKQANTYSYEGKSISNQPIPFPIDRDTQDFHALFQYMF